jgi:hypothetical protein
VVVSSDVDPSTWSWLGIHQYIQLGIFLPTCELVTFHRCTTVLYTGRSLPKRKTVKGYNGSFMLSYRRTEWKRAFCLGIELLMMLMIYLQRVCASYFQVRAATSQHVVITTMAQPSSVF